MMMEMATGQSRDRSVFSELQSFGKLRVIAD